MGHRGETGADTSGSGAGNAPTPQSGRAPPPVPPHNSLVGITQEQVIAIPQLYGTSGRTKNVPAKTLDVFNGSPETAHNFINDCQLQFNVNPHNFEGLEEDRKKVGYALSFMMEGAARDFQKLQWQEYEITKRWDSWNEFLEKFKSQFMMTDEAGTALKKLQGLKMKSTADEYVAKFKLLAREAKVTEDTMLKALFMQGLKPSLLEWLGNRDAGVPATADELMKVIQDKDTLWRQMHSLPIHKNPFQWQQRTQSRWQNQQQYQNQNRDEYMGEPMEIDAIQGRGGRPEQGQQIGQMRGPDGRLTPEEQDRRRRLGLCYFCAGENHMAINCPAKTRGRGRASAPYTSNNPFRRTQAAVAEAIPQTPHARNLTVEEQTT